jgi:ADP-ribose pyrophosphatase
MPKPWKTLSSSITYRKKWLQIREEACELPDGRVLDPYIIIDIPSFCNIVIVTEKEEVVLVKQFRHAVGIASIELPGGMIDKGEAPIEAAKREMQEETGYSSNDVELLYTVHPNPPLEHNKAWFFLARNAVQNVATNFDPYEDIELVLYTKEQFLEMLKDNSFTHGTQAGSMFAAALKLGWLKMP